MPDAPEDAIYIEELAETLGRAAHTIRFWLREEQLPKKLRPKRTGGRRKLYWLPGQVDGLKKFAAKREARKGWQGQHA